MPTALIIPADPRQPLRLEQLSRGLDDYQRLVGGFAEAYRLDFPSGHLYANEDGKRLNLPANARASLLLWIHNITFLGTHLLGDGFILGPPTSGGDATDVPDDLVQLLLHTSTYATQARAGGAKWAEADKTYGEWTEAYADIANLAARWMHVGAIRVIPHEGPEVARLKAEWLAIGRERPDIREAHDPPFRLESFCPCYTIDELEERLTSRVWPVGTAFYYRDLCFIRRQIGGGDEWLTIRHGIAFEYISAKLIIQRGKFRDLINRFLAATAEQCRNLTY